MSLKSIRKKIITCNIMNPIIVIFCLIMGVGVVADPIIGLVFAQTGCGLPGDCNDNCTVDIFDLVIVGNSFVVTE